MRLHEAIQEVLADAGRGLRAREIADEVNARGTYARRDGAPLPPYQVTSRVHSYPNLFDVEEGVVTLRTEDAEPPVEEGTATDDPAGEPDAPPTSQPGNRITRGIAGEHFVAAELSKRGWIATITAKNTQHVDVLAHRPGSDGFAALQVKTRGTAYRYAWRVRRAGPTANRNFFVFVDLGDVDEPPTFWIVPSAEVDRLLASEQIRTADIEEFRERWDLLDDPEEG